MALPPLDLHAWLAARGHDVDAILAGDEAATRKEQPAPHPTTVSPAGPTSIAPANASPTNTAAVEKYAATALAAEVNAIRCAQQGNRNNVFNEAAFKVYSLVGSGAISRDHAEQELFSAARAIGLDEQEIAKTLGSAAKGIESPRDLSNVGQGGGQSIDFSRYSQAMLGGCVVATDSDGQDSIAISDASLDASPPTTTTISCPPGLEDNPHRLAQLFSRRVNHPDGLRLRFWRDKFHWWDGCAYRELPDKEIRAEVANFLAAEMLRLHQIALIAYGMRQASGGSGGGGGGESNGNGETNGNRSSGDKPKGPPKPIPVTTRLVGDVLQALSGVTLLPARDVPEQPAWIGTPRKPWPAAEVLPMRNAIVHLPSVVAGNPFAAAEPTPLFFAANALTYDYVVSPPTPAGWLEFLEQIWIDDHEAINTLQEWMGYLLTPDTSMQKILLMTGPPRCGKGTIARVIRAMVGEENLVNPTLTSLATQFGLEPLLGKNVAIITDARIDHRTETSVAIERLLSISGQDSQTVPRKLISAINTVLPTRFMLISNLVPQLQDQSGALASRMIFLNFKSSFLGRENRTLFSDKLVPELPGILRWAIDGWARLRDRGHFLQPASGMEEKELMEDISSPISEFLRDCCERGSDPEVYRVTRTDLFTAWQSWCQSRGMKHTGSQAVFGRNLRSVVPELTNTRARKDGKLTWYYCRVRLADQYAEEQSRGVQKFIESFENEQDRKYTDAREYMERNMKWDYDEE